MKKTFFQFSRQEYGETLSMGEGVLEKIEVEVADDKYENYYSFIFRWHASSTEDYLMPTIELDKCAFSAFVDLNDFFAELSSMKKDRLSAEDICDLLEKHGFRDVSDRPRELVHPS